MKPISQTIINLNEILKGEMKRRGVAQIAIAELLGYQPAQVSNLLSGKRRWKLDELERVLRFLDMDFSATMQRAANVVALNDHGTGIYDFQNPDYIRTLRESLIALEKEHPDRYYELQDLVDLWIERARRGRPPIDVKKA